MTSTSTSTSPERARLTAALRELKARTGLSLAGLAERTTYSKSSWERYLNGKALPPRRAVRDLCRLAGEADGRCLALWEIAEAEWSGRGTPSPPPAEPVAAPAPAPAPPRDDGRTGARRSRAAVTLLVLLCALAAGSVAVAAVLLARQDGTSRSSPPAPSPSAPGPRCRDAGCEGQNPMHMICGGAPKTLSTHRTATGARVELRYSEECRAGWARMWGTRVGDRLEVAAGGPTHDVEIADALDAEAYIHTTMTAARPGAVLRACFGPAADGERECFTTRVE
ncbi:DUF2690 domain-containing protein [Streptomyces sp. HMX87]|uniref:helix-turn-helix domain-containing protein n=1 Tax=Streptomyces sp. HMX87 TaxID=3390849 RepID=UPI003A86A005